MKKWISLFVSLVLFLGVFGTAGLSLAEEEAVTVTFTTDAVTLAVGKTATVKANASPYAAKKKGVEFTSSDENIATVASNGKVTAVAAGQCQIIATSKYDTKATASLPVTVITLVKKLVVSADSDALLAGRTLQLNVAYEPADATQQSATYASLNKSVATVSETGLVTGVKRGTASISVKSADGNAKATVKITVKQAPESVTVSPENAEAAVGRKVTLKATVLPTSANDKSLTWVSADENVATVSSKGVVTIVSVGSTTVTVTCNDDPSVTASVPVRGLELAQSVAFDSDLYSLFLNGTVQLNPIVLPDTTTDKTVTYKVANRKIATVDENGLVTGVKGGKTTVTASTADGSKKSAKTTIQVIVPVTGVSYKYKDVRVGVSSTGTFTAAVSPSDATDKTMSWVSSDESIATVTGTTNRFKIKGLKWGRCKVTGTTADGGYTVEINVDIGSLKRVISATSVTIKDGKPYLTLINNSNMNITQIRFEMKGYDSTKLPIAMSTTGDLTILEGAYESPLAEGESTQHGTFTFYNKSDYPNLAILQFAVTGWSTDTGYYDSNGQLQYNYNISEDSWDWTTYPAGAI
jgi:uncharacterized protein YjdB